MADRPDRTENPGLLARSYRIWGYVKVSGALISGMAVFGMMCFILADVVSRNFLGGSISGSYEIAQNYFMPVAVFPGLAYVYSSGVLPRMDLLVHRVPTLVRRAAAYVLLGLELVLFSLLVRYTWDFAVDGRDREVAFPAGGSLYTLWPLYFLVPLGFAMILVETLFVILRNLTRAGAGLAWAENGTEAA